MADTMSKSIGPFAVWDFPLPSQVENYTTLIILHGLAWHSGIFMRMAPFAKQNSCRLVLVNRRDYPGSLPYSEEELQPLMSAVLHEESPEALSKLLAYTKARAQELHDFLCTFVQNEGILESSIVLVGWSLGSTWITQLLVHASSLSTGAVALRKYIRRVVWYGPPNICLGYPFPADAYNPFTHPSHAPSERANLFNLWVTGYYDHGDFPAQMEQRTPLRDPPPTISTMTTSDLESALHTAPGQPSGSDYLLMTAGVRHGLWEALRKQALLISPMLPDVTDDVSSDSLGWDDLELRCVWCDQAPWESPWAVWSLQAELRTTKQTGKKTRNVTFTKITKANQFAHWDQPERALKALLLTTPEI